MTVYYLGLHYLENKFKIKTFLTEINTHTENIKIT